MVFFDDDIQFEPDGRDAERGTCGGDITQCVYVRVCMWVYVCMYVYVCMCVCMLCMYVFMYVYASFLPCLNMLNHTWSIA